MSLQRTIVATMAASLLAAGHPAPNALGSNGSGPHGDIVVFDSKVESAVYVPEVVIWDENDDMRTSTQTVLHLPLSMASSNTAGNILFPSESTTTMKMTAYFTETVTLPAQASTASAQLPVATTPSTNGNRGNSSELFGVSYAPYRSDHQCKSQDEINDDVAQIAGRYSVIRIYGTDCDQVPMVYKAAKAKGMKLFLGIWEPSAVEYESNKITAGINNDWDIVHTVSIGNELVNNGQSAPGDIVSAVQEARSTLRDAGYKGPVVSVDTFEAVLAHPELCEASDYCAVNAHPFFDSTTTASHAGLWLMETIKKVNNALSVPKRVIITETGWPTKGIANGLAIPGLANQKMAIDSIHKSFVTNPGDVILFSAFNDLWKAKKAATFYSDQYWGIDGAVAKSDQ